MNQVATQATEDVPEAEVLTLLQRESLRSFARRQILRAMRDSDEPMSAQDLAELKGVPCASSPCATFHLLELLRCGLVVESGKESVRGTTSFFFSFAGERQAVSEFLRRTAVADMRQALEMGADE